MDKLQPLMPQNITKTSFHLKDEWVVVVNRKEHCLNGKQAEILKKITEHRSKGIIWFEKFAISIPHIQEIYRTKSGLAEERYNKKYNNKKLKKETG